MLSLLTAPLLAASPLCIPQQNWVDLDGSNPPGTPPTVEVVPGLSGRDRTVVEVRIPGLWTEAGLAADENPYIRYSLPETESVGVFTTTTGQVGAPELPALDLVVALPPGGSEAPINYGDFTGTTVMYLDVTESANGAAQPLPLPLHAPGWNGDPDSGIPEGIPPQFHFDPTVYGATTLYPAQNVAVGDPFVMAGGVSAVPIELRPFQYDPVENRIAYYAQFRFTIYHPGLPGALATVSRDAAHPAEQLSLNFTEIEYTYNELDPGEGRSARFLILASEEHSDELLPLVQQRRLTGFDVELVRLESLPDTEPSTVRAALGLFLDAAPDGHDSYALLVGDVERIPLHPPVDPNGQPGDGPYGRPLVDDGARLHVGRLSVNDGADLARQVQKVVDFERVQATSNQQVGLAAHKHAGSGIADSADFDLWQANFGATMAAAGFKVEVASGNQAASSTKLQESCANGTFLVYHGFGSAFAWPDWTIEGDSLGVADVLALDNEVTPIHFAYAPRTAAVDEDDSLAEAWLAAEHGAVAVIGALTSTPIALGYKLDRCFIKSWSTSGDASPPLGLQFSAAQDANGESVAEDDRWLLVGDPGLTVPTGSSAATDDVLIDGKLITAENYDASVVIGGSMKFRVEDASGDPVDGVLVSVVIGESSLGPNGELLPAVFQKDVYTVGGDAEIEFVEVGGGPDWTPTSKPTASVNLLFGDGSVRFITDSIGVYGDSSDLGGGAAGSLGEAPCLWSVDTLEVGETLELGLSAAPAGALGALFLSVDSMPLPLGSGVFHAWPIAAAWLFDTDAAGDASFSLGPLPAPLPAGMELALQAIVVDASVASGHALSNGLLATH